MSKKWYGNVMNRLGEGRNYTHRELQIGDDITMYLWSDRECYYITDVISQKEIKVKEYYVCADHSKPGGMGHQNWLYFKTLKEERDYLRQYFPDREEVDIPEPEPETWVYRYNKWQEMCAYTPEAWNNLVQRCKEDIKDPDNNMENVIHLAQCYAHLSDEDVAKINAGKTIRRYHDLSGKVSFGIRDYYYDWEF